MTTESVSMKPKIHSSNKWSKGTYHYEYDITECVLCGSGDTLKHRVLGPRPKDLNEVYSYTQYACGYHFC